MCSTAVWRCDEAGYDMKLARDEGPLAESVKSCSSSSRETLAETLKLRLSRSACLLGLIIKIKCVIELGKALARQKLGLSLVTSPCRRSERLVGVAPYLCRLFRFYKGIGYDRRNGSARVYYGYE